MNAINRVPAGVPSGGQFAEGHRAESSIAGLSALPFDEPSTATRNANYEVVRRASERLLDLEARRIAHHAQAVKPDAKTVSFTYIGEGQMELDGIDGESYPWDDHTDEMTLAAGEIECETSEGLDYRGSGWQYEAAFGNLDIDIAGVNSNPIPAQVHKTSPFDPVGREVQAAYPDATGWAPEWNDTGDAYTEEITVFTPGRSPQKMRLGASAGARAQIDWLTEQAQASGEAARPASS